MIHERMGKRKEFDMDPITTEEWTKLRKIWLRIAREEMTKPLFRVAMDNEKMAAGCAKIESGKELIIDGLAEIAE